MAFYYSRRKLKVREEDEVGELNVVPYLDVLMNLIMFVLMSITGLASFGILNVSAPASESAPATTQEQASNRPSLLLTVMITDRGFVVATTGTVLEGQPGEKGGPTIPKKADGSYDYAALSAALVKIKQAVPEETRAFVGAESAIPYEALISTMDALRETPETPKRQLFPDVTLAAM